MKCSIRSFYLTSILIPFTTGKERNRATELSHKSKLDNLVAIENYQFVNEVTNTIETIPWGIAEVLQNVTFWDNTYPPDEGIKVCVIGSGYDIGHADLPVAPDVIGTDASSGESWSVDLVGYGTHSAGTIAAIGNDEGVVGIFPNNKGGKFKLVIGKTSMGSSHGKATLASHMDAINACVAQGAKVISTPMGSECFSQREANYFNKLYNQGILIFAPAGDDGDETYTYPASLPSVISVASSNQQREWDGSQMNDQIELTAPGVNIMSTLPNNQYASWDGTAMATAHAAGVAGLLWMHFPTCTNVQIRNVLAKTALDIGVPGCDDKFGHGLIQAKNAYDLLSEGDCGGDIGADEPIGGCFQLSLPILSNSCTIDSDCDDSDPCTVDTCQDSVCNYDHDCLQCGKTDLVTVTILTDKYPEETTWEVIDYETNERVMAKNTSSYGNCDRLYSKSQCLDKGGYLFIIYDSEFDGICCDYGRGRYEVSVGGDRKVLGGEFEDSKSHFFRVDGPTNSPRPTAPKSPTASPTTAKPTVTWNPTISPTASQAPTSLACASGSDCDDGDDCTDDTCVASKCKFILNCASCGLSNEVKVDIRTDHSPEETSWEITNYYTYESYMKSSSYSKINHIYSTSKCFGSGSYVFSIYDAADDGVCCLYGEGYYSVSIGDKKLASGGKFKSVEMHIFSIDDVLPTNDPRDIIPTWAPTRSDHPTSAPTATYLPTNVPSKSNSPTVVHSDLPSISPSFNPSSLPSYLSSLSPSDKPSSNPSVTPSDLPSLSPSHKPSRVHSDLPSESQSPSHKPSTTPSRVSSSPPSESQSPSSSPSITPTLSDQPTASPSLFPSTHCAVAYEISRECKNNQEDAPVRCCPGLKCDSLYCTPDCGGEGMEAQECGAGPSAKLNCCPGTVCDGAGKCKLPATCAAIDAPAGQCGAWLPEFEKCCEGLICKYKKCAEDKPCAREDQNSKQCGGLWSMNDECCEGYMCSTVVGAKNCVRNPDDSCGALGKQAKDCGADPTVTKNILCCEGLTCVPGITLCKNEFATVGNPAILCGDETAAAYRCKDGHYCDPYPPTSHVCIQEYPCAPEGKNARACGGQWAKLGYCCEGLKCGANSKACVKA